MNSPEQRPPVDLDNCDREPIHIPGSIQPHGALLAFDGGGNLCAWSANAPRVLHFAPAAGMALSDLPLDAEVRAALAECLLAAADGDGEAPPVALETVIEGVEFDFVVHGHDHRLIAEFERREQTADEVAAFALKAHRAIDRLKRQKTLPALLQMAVQQVRAVTGFDRVMAYRFRHDDSGDVVAEARREDLVSFLDMRYPASDIPAQARRLYTINTLRMIGDIGYTPAALLGAGGTMGGSSDAGAGGRFDDGEDPSRPLDMSHCILRSVSPIHVEYLQNMGVGASMSVSIVVAGRLWGMLACHHMSPYRVPYSVRMACDVMAQVLAASVQTLDVQAHAVRAAAAAEVRNRLFETLMHEDDVLRGLMMHEGPLRETLGAQALIFAQQGKQVCFGEVAPEQAAAIIDSLPDGTGDMIHRARLSDWPEAARGKLGRWVGMLALQFDPAIAAWIVALRPEEIETVRWAGKPEKTLKTGPLGQRLTPRGSFEEWRETVRGSAEPWDESYLFIARQLLAEMHRVSSAHHAEVERARTQLLAMLGHDLRDPLQAITMAAKVIEHGAVASGSAPGEKMSRRIQSSSSRMQRLISQVLDMSRLEAGLGLGLNLAQRDLARLISELVEESRTAYPGAVYELRVPTESVTATVDADRVGQVVSNLVSNARHHGRPGHPIQIELCQHAGRALIEVSNAGDPIEQALADNLFAPFKRQVVRNQRNPTGMGLGLHIAHRIIEEHGGAIRYYYRAPRVVFSVELPLRPADKPAT